MSLPASVEIHEVGPREGFQYEGIGRPDAIRTRDKVRVINALASTGLTRIQVASFVHPRLVPQMADAEKVCSQLEPTEDVEYTAVYLNDVGLRRALATSIITVQGKLTLTASETFANRNQNRSLEDDLAMAALMGEVYQEHDIAVTVGSVMAAFGCNYEGAVPLNRVLALVDELVKLADQAGGLQTLILADTMGWAQPDQVRSAASAIRARWPELRLGLHLHDTRGLGLANVYAGLLEGIDLFDTSIAGIGGCPFADHKDAAGNVATEGVVFLCRSLGVDVSPDIPSLLGARQVVSEALGRPLTAMYEDDIAVRVAGATKLDDHEG